SSNDELVPQALPNQRQGREGVVCLAKTDVLLIDALGPRVGHDEHGASVERPSDGIEWIVLRRITKHKKSAALDFLFCRPPFGLDPISQGRVVLPKLFGLEPLFGRPTAPNRSIDASVEWLIIP